MLTSHKPDKYLIVVANSCADAFTILNNKKYRQFDIVFLDWSLPPSEANDIYNGGDLHQHIKNHSPNCKLIILSSHTEAIILYQIGRDINPNALLCKIDFTIEDFPKLMETIATGQSYYSQTVKKQIRQITSKQDYLDNYNRQIILLLSKGVKTKNLPQYLPLSISAIDKRKAQIKDYFLLGRGTDDDILAAAKKEGLI